MINVIYHTISSHTRKSRLFSIHLSENSGLRAEVTPPKNTMGQGSEPLRKYGQGLSFRIHCLARRSTMPLGTRYRAGQARDLPSSQCTLDQIVDGEGASLCSCPTRCNSFNPLCFVHSITVEDCWGVIF